MGYLHLQPYRQTTITLRRNQKLAPKYYSPFQVISRVGLMVYWLSLSPKATIYPFFHLPLLKKKLGSSSIVVPHMPLTNTEDQLHIEPIEVLARRIVPRCNKAVTQVLIQWSNMPKEDVTWEDWSVIDSHLPNFFTPWGQGFVQGEGNCHIQS